ncbi:hypothetical protein NXS08_00165 [Gleimia sp. 6138-11-ORH1]|uniref:hypothetical protein n=1 Tax=Gleimia sp. 6138-11-ORH1 TaxID=2973937 RepID=UPI0021697C0E|nr:hypothetical protein [Gleimia sp. 6138-11-ORH1]MCS4483908.1 hypothetical protein [Gleimia sp. 6138-11-ORH1]
MSLKRKLLSLKVWRLGGWGLSVFIAVATTIQLLGVLLSAVPTGLLVTNTNLFISGLEQSIEFPRTAGNLIVLILTDLLLGLLTLMVWWFTYRAYESLPYFGQTITEKKRRRMVTQWHEASIVLLLIGSVGTFANLIQRLWLWYQVIAPHLKEESIEYPPIGVFAVLFNDWGLLFSAPTVMILSGLAIFVFFEKLESPESIVKYEREVYGAEEPPLTTGIIALQALPDSMKQMPKDLRALPWRLWQRAVNFFQSTRR